MDYLGGRKHSCPHSLAYECREPHAFGESHTTGSHNFHTRNPFLEAFMKQIVQTLRKLNIRVKVPYSLKIFFFLRWATCRALEGPGIGQDLDITYLRQGLLYEKLLKKHL